MIKIKMFLTLLTMLCSLKYLQKLYLLSLNMINYKASTLLAAGSFNIHYQAQSAYILNEDNYKQYPIGVTCGLSAKPETASLMGLSRYFVCSPH